MSAKTTLVRYIKTLLANGIAEDNVYGDVEQETLIEHRSHFKSYEA